MSSLFVHRFTILDAALLDPALGLVGESWLVDLELDGALDDQGMVLDFGVIKRRIRAEIDQEFDHRLLVPARHGGCAVRRLEDGAVEVRMELDSGVYVRHRGPAESVALIDAERINAQSLATAIHARLLPTLPSNVTTLRLSLRHEAGPGPFFRYSHGLRQHAGNCQRIAHGHRSRIEIERDGERDRGLEAEWAAHWEDIYLGNRADLRGEFVNASGPFYRFGYRSTQGEFTLELPQARCELIDSETTIENLARFVAERLRAAHPESNFKVRAFEGVDKGAVGEA